LPLTDTNIGDLRFLEIRVDPNVLERHKRQIAVSKNRSARRSERSFATRTRDRSTHLRSSERQPRRSEIGLGRQHVRVRRDGRSVHLAQVGVALIAGTAQAATALSYVA